MKKENTYYEKLITRYLYEECNAKEIQELEKWVKESPENQKHFKEMKKLNMLTSLKNSIHISGEWEKLQQAIGTDKKTVSLDKIEKPFSRKTYLKWGIAAAIVLLLSFTFYLSNLNSSIEYKTQTAAKEIQNIDLVDKSIVDLDLNASLTYPDKFSNERFVKLKGTAFFDIERDEAHPFIIETHNARIKVLGTSFLVKSDQNKTEVIVKSGRVSLSNEEQGEIILTKGEKGIISKQKFEKTNNRDINFLSWKTQELIFDKSSLVYVIRKINETYHTHLKLANKNIKACSLSAEFKHQDLTVVLEVISKALDLEVKKEGNTIWISGDGCEK